MQTRYRKVLLAVGLLLLIGVMIYFAYDGDAKKRYAWYKIYSYDSKEPFGGYMTATLLKKYHKGKNFSIINKPFSEWLRYKKDSVPANYVFIGESMFMDSLDAQPLLDFISKGNTAFISCTYLSNYLTRYMYYKGCYIEDGETFYSKPDSTVCLNFTHPQLKTDSGYNISFRIKEERQSYDWSYIDTSYYCDSLRAFFALGQADSGRINFVQVPMGQGKLLVHTQPIVFTNYQMKDSLTLLYAEKVFSHLPPGDIYWDEYTRIMNGYQQRSDGPLKYILSQPPLRWAWYLAVAMACLFLLFYTRRRQRTIPVVRPNLNTSLEFVKTIGRLYFQQQNHQQLCKQKIKLFYGYIRNRYGLSTAKLDGVFMKKLSEKSQIPLETVQRLFSRFLWVENMVTITEQDLTDFHSQLMYFYKNCK